MREENKKTDTPLWVTGCHLLRMVFKQKVTILGKKERKLRLKENNDGKIARLYLLAALSLI